VVFMISRRSPVIALRPQARVRAPLSLIRASSEHRRVRRWARKSGRYPPRVWAVGATRFRRSAYRASETGCSRASPGSASRPMRRRLGRAARHRRGTCSVRAWRPSAGPPSRSRPPA